MRYDHLPDYTWDGMPDWVYSCKRTTGFSGEILVLDVRYHDTTFDDLELLSQTFGTRAINVGSEAREGGYCDTCAYSYSVNIITIMCITKWSS